MVSPGNSPSSSHFDENLDSIRQFAGLRSERLFSMGRSGPAISVPEPPTTDHAEAFGGSSAKSYEQRKFS